jgi:hypothetical protein
MHHRGTLQQALQWLGTLLNIHDPAIRTAKIGKAAWIERRKGGAHGALEITYIADLQEYFDRPLRGALAILEPEKGFAGLSFLAMVYGFCHVMVVFSRA